MKFEKIILLTSKSFIEIAITFAIIYFAFMIILDNYSKFILIISLFLELL